MLKKEISELVDLSTTDEDLEDIMLIKYPGIITGKKHIVDSDSDGRIFRFMDLDKDTIVGYLKKYNSIYEYELTYSKTGKPFVKNIPNYGLN